MGRLRSPQSAKGTELGSRPAPSPLAEEQQYYSLHQVEVLLGLYEGLGAKGKRHVTILDIVSQAGDPGGDMLTLRRAQEEGDREWWMGRRGPLAPDSFLACVLYDFERAVKRLPLFEHVVVALTVMGFSASDIASVIDPDGVLDLEDPHTPPKVYRNRVRELDNRRKRIARLLEGRPKRDADGNEVRDEDGDLVYSGGLSPKLARMMNGSGKPGPAAA